jgi:hypothetical protein
VKLIVRLEGTNRKSRRVAELVAVHGLDSAGGWKLEPIYERSLS